jgi:very-short-patch-repair endonuclease
MTSLGWTIIRFTDDEIESKTRAVVDRVLSIALAKGKALENPKK